MPFPLLLSFPHSFLLRKIKVPCTPAHKIIWNNLKQSWKQMYYSEESNRKFSLRGIPHEDPFFFFSFFSPFFKSFWSLNHSNYSNQLSQLLLYCRKFYIWNLIFRQYSYAKSAVHHHYLFGILIHHAKI